MRFSVLVVGPDCANALQDVLMPYFEHTDFPPYIKFNREDKKAERKRLQRYWGKRLRENPHDVGIFNKYEDKPAAKIVLPYKSTCPISVASLFGVVSSGSQISITSVLFVP